MTRTDILIVGAGIAGAGLAAALGGRRDTIMIEREERPGHHSTGRSAAIFIQNYGNAVIRALSAASRPLFDARDETVFPHPLLSGRGILFVADGQDLGQHWELLGESQGLVPMNAEEAVAMVPLLRVERIAAAAYERDASDIDVHGLHQGWLRIARQAGTQLLTNTALVGARRSGGRWKVETTAGEIEAGVIVNASGAWADVVAAACGASALGLVPKRRSMAVIPCPAGYDCRSWPLISNSADRWYAKPDAGRLMISPSEEDPVEPHDAYVDEMVLAEGLDRYQQAVHTQVTRLEAKWAGLRTFAPDQTPVVGFDPSVEAFFWLAGQGGYGIQTAPAMSKVARAALVGEMLDPPLQSALAAMAPARLLR
jgi:D-arginine dehydrogenase